MDFRLKKACFRRLIRIAWRGAREDLVSAGRAQLAVREFDGGEIGRTRFDRMWLRARVEFHTQRGRRGGGLQGL